MGSKTRLSSYCTKRANNGVNLVTSRKMNTRLARPIALRIIFIIPTGYLPVIPWVSMKYRWIFEQFLVFFLYYKWNTEKNTRKLLEYHLYFLKTHSITVLSYSYLIFTHHNALYRQLTGVKRDFFSNVCMYSIVRP